MRPLEPKDTAEAGDENVTPRTNAQNSARRQLTPEEWEELRPIIKRYYMDEYMTFKQVASILHDQYNFQPTKKQFVSRIQKWGFRKNTTNPDSLPKRWKQAPEHFVSLDSKHEAFRFVHDNLSTSKSEEEKFKGGKSLATSPIRDASGTAEIAVSSFSGIGRHPEDPRAVPSQVNLESSSSLGGRLAGSDGVPNVEVDIEPASGLPPVTFEIEEITAQTGRVGRGQDPETLWDSARIQDSPTLTTLFEAFKVDEQIPHLSLERSPCSTDYVSLVQLDNKQFEENETVNESSSRALTVTRSVNSHRKFKRSAAVTINHLLLSNSFEKSIIPSIELNPFPASTLERKRPYNDSVLVQGSVRPLKIQISESRDHLSKFKDLLPAYSSGMAAKMKELADLYRENRQHSDAEPLYVQAYKVQQRLLGTNHPVTIQLYYDFIWNRCQWGKASEVEKIHEDNYMKIFDYLGPGHLMSLKSLSLMGSIYYYLGKIQQSEQILRKLLQLGLNKYGPSNTWTAKILSNLASMMFLLSEKQPAHESMKTLVACEHLIQYCLQIKRNIGRDITDMHATLDSLAGILSKLGRIDELLSISRIALQLLLEGYGFEHKSSLKFSLTTANGLRRSGNLDGAAKISKLTLFTLTRDIKSTEFGEAQELRTEALEEFMLALEGVRQWQEASARAEELHRAYFKRYESDPNNDKVQKSIEKLSYYYSKQGLYNDKDDFRRRLAWVRNQEEFTTLHTENGNDTQLDREIEEIREWFTEWVYTSSESQKRRRKEE